MPNSGYPFAAKVGQIKPPNWANSEYRKQVRGHDAACAVHQSSLRRFIAPGQRKGTTRQYHAGQVSSAGRTQRRVTPCSGSRYQDAPGRLHIVQIRARPPQQPLERGLDRRVYTVFTCVGVRRSRKFAVPVLRNEITQIVSGAGSIPSNPIGWFRKVKCWQVPEWSPVVDP